MDKPNVTIVITPRERFSAARESLESILTQTPPPYRLVYVDGGSPRSLAAYLQRRAEQVDFTLVRTEHYLSPNRARNLGLGHVDTDFVVFVDNDVIVSPGWLETLLACAEDTGAAVVSPLICQHRPVHSIVHCAGGESGILQSLRAGTPHRQFIERIHGQGKHVSDMRDRLRRSETGLAEFHCMLVRRQIFERTGWLDEALLSSKEHVDFCISVQRAGGSIYLEPDSVVTYLGAPPLAVGDLPYYMLRWSDAWELASLHRLRDKWGLTEDGYLENRYKNVGWRRRLTLLRPWSKRLSEGLGGRGGRRLERLLTGWERRLNQWIVRRYTQRHGGALDSPVGVSGHTSLDV